MKLLLFIATMCFYSFAAPNVTYGTKCFSIKDNLDRDYCKKKKISIIKSKYAKEKSTWSKGVSAATKSQKSQAIALEIQEKEEMIEMHTAELNLLKENQASLNKAKVLKKKKKKKKKKNDLEKALNIKL